MLGTGELDDRLGVAQAVALEAGRLAASMHLESDGGLQILTKGKFDLSTAADSAVERLIREKLAGHFNDPVLGEELGGEIAETLWVVDPIDGTYNFIHGLPNWGVSIGLMHAGSPVLGVIYNPTSGELFSAIKGRGATLNGGAMRVSGAAHISRPLVEVGWSNRQTLESYLALQSRLTAAEIEVRQQGSAALGLASVACGRLDAYIEAHINSWDVLAGLVLVGEAGGWSNDFLANGGLSKGNPVLACTPPMRAQLSAIADIR